MSEAQEVELKTVNELASHVVSWAQNCHAQINQIINIPDTEELEVTNEDTGEVTRLQGAERKAFLAGMAVAQTYFARLPFRAETFDQDEPEA